MPFLLGILCVVNNEISILHESFYSLILFSGYLLSFVG